jgi:endonuclease/exonuclease/phosphatase family metal-dependent hydrolase
MPQLKIATFNVEWMVSVFGGQWKDWNGKIPASFPGQKGPIRLAAIKDVPGLCQRIAGVITTIDPDVIGIEEGPPLLAQMQLFVKQFLGDRYHVYQSNEKRQSIFGLVRKALAGHITHEPYNSQALALLNGKFPFYPWLGFQVKDQKQHQFDRVPLVLKFRPTAQKELQIVVVHTKSKFSMLKTRKQWESREKEAVLSALDSRQKLSAEVGQLRKYVTAQLQPMDSHKGVLVMGDFNDGPFADLMEREFLLHNIVDELVGSFLEPDKYLRHAMTPAVLKNAETVRFPDPLQNGQTVGEFIDHVLLSPSLVGGNGAFTLRANSCQVETAAYNQFNADVHDNDRGLRPSDHRPVSVVIDY